MSGEPGHTVSAREPPQSTLHRFWKPRYWPAWGLWLWLRLNAALPLGAALAIHRVLGRVLYRAAPKMRSLATRNIEICFPELSAAAREALVKEHFEALAMSLAECGAGWFASARQLDGRFDVHGIEHLNRALEKGKGVILYTGHFTTLEICGWPFKSFTSRFGAMFSHRNNALLEHIQVEGQRRMAHDMIPSDSVRAMLRSLKANGVVWYAPDRFAADGALVPFFHELAMTTVVTSKLARVSGTRIVPFSFRRLRNRDPRYELRFHAELEGFPSDDPVADTRRLVVYLEEFVRACPEQYQWVHKRFKGRPAELPDLYDR